MGLAALSESWDFKGGGGGGVWFQKKKKVNVKKVSFFYISHHSLKAAKAARPIEAMIGVSKAS